MGITRKSSWSSRTIFCLLLLCCTEVSISKFTYKKPIFSKEKYQKQNLDLIKTSTPSLPKTESDLNSTQSTTPTESLTTASDVESSTDLTLTLTSKEDKLSLGSSFGTTTADSNDILPTITYTPPAALSSEFTSTIVAPTTELFSKGTTTATTIPDDDDEPLPCTCGIFLSSQFAKGSQDPPKGEAVISNSLGRTFPCNGVGQKQCQTKCLQQIVQHLPNSANILCASVDKDIRKERAYLFIKNCENEWINTNLAAGREYCCKNREPYNCK